MATLQIIIITNILIISSVLISVDYLIVMFVKFKRSIATVIMPGTSHDIIILKIYKKSPF